MANRSAYEGLLVVTLTRHTVEIDGEEINTRCVNLTIDSLDIEEPLFAALIDRSFPKSEVRRPRIGRASLDFCLPVGIDDQILADKLAERIGQVATMVLSR